MQSGNDFDTLFGSVFFEYFFYIAYVFGAIFAAVFLGVGMRKSRHAVKNHWDILVYCWLVGWSFVMWGFFEFHLTFGLGVLPILIGSTVWFFLIRKSIHRKRNAREQEGEEPNHTRITSSIHIIQMVINLLLFPLAFVTIPVVFVSLISGDVLFFIIFCAVTIALTLIGTRILYVLGRVRSAFWISFVVHMLLIFSPICLFLIQVNTIP